MGIEEKTKVKKNGGRPSSAKSETKTWLIAFKLLECLKSQPNTPTSYYTIFRDLKNVFSNILENNEKRKRVRKAVELLKEAGYIVESTNSPDGFMYVEKYKTYIPNITKKYALAKCGILKNLRKNIEDAKVILSVNEKRTKEFIDKFIYTENSVDSVDFNEVLNTEKIVSAIENKKYLTFRVDSVYKRYDFTAIYRPLKILVDSRDNNKLYLATIFQLQKNRHYHLDFIPISQIYELKETDQQFKSYISLRKLYEELVPYYLDLLPAESKENTEEQALIYIFEHLMYYGQFCEIQYTNPEYVEDLENSFERVYTDVDDIDNPTKFFSMIYYKNLIEVFNWVYQKTEKLRIIRKNQPDTWEEIKKLDYEGMTESEIFKEFGKNGATFSSPTMQADYIAYESKRFFQEEEHEAQESLCKKDSLTEKKD